VSTLAVSTEGVVTVVVLVESPVGLVSSVVAVVVQEAKIATVERIKRMFFMI
jgi:hypothetical protein